MRILAISDTELPELGSRLTADRLADIDLVISCGDLPARYLTAIADIANKPVAFVPGNHDRSSAAGEVPGCVNLDGRIEPELAHPAGTRIVNCCGSTRIEVPEEGIPRRRAPRLLRVERL